MKVYDVGQGSPEIAVVGCLHGDEKCGKIAIERVKARELDFIKPVRFIVANERALEKGERCIDVDLNRCFPGDPDSDLHEERLAYELLNKIEGMKVLDLHSTYSQTDPHVYFMGQERLELAKSVGVSKLVDLRKLENLLIEQGEIEGVAVECGTNGKEQTFERAEKTIIEFLGNHGAIDASISEVEHRVFEVYDVQEGEGYSFVGENFRKVEKGEVFARKNDVELRAEKDFYPVLMSDNGYPDKIGFKARRLE